MDSARFSFAAASILALGIAVAACSSSSSGDDTTPSGSAGSSASGGTSGGGSGGSAGAPSLYDKYGGAMTVAKVVDDAVTGLLADPEEAPFFAVVGTTGHDTVDHLKSCLRLQFTVALGGPGTYPSDGDDGMACHDMASIHADLAVTSDVFDKFIMDLGAVLTADGVSADDVQTIAGALTPLKSQIVTADGAGGAAGSGGAAGGGG